MRLFESIGIGVTLATAIACGSNESNSPKTVCNVGDTRACLGPGQCAGAQTCLADRTGYGECDCGGGGGAGGTAGSAGSVGTGGAAGSSGTGGTAGASSACPVGLPGPGLVQVPTLTGGAYCIDNTEVTQAQYAEFLGASPPTSGQPSTCTWNDSFVPDTTPGIKCFEGVAPYDPTTTPDNPVSCVDWCDAVAYCTWAGKHLCGRIGGGSADPTKLADASESEWFNACSKGGTLAYPYGDTYVYNNCNTGSGFALWPAGQLPDCVGGYPGLHDMSGNVIEWEDGCANDDCPIRGGSVTTQPPAGSRCDAIPTGSRSAVGFNVGFRCCADLGG